MSRLLGQRAIHPTWCDGGDHAEVAREMGDDVEPAHYTTAGDTGRLTVTIEQPVELGAGRGGPVVTLDGLSADDSERYLVKMTSTDARTVAAMLLRAADKIELS